MAPFEDFERRLPHDLQWSRSRPLMLWTGPGAIWPRTRAHVAIASLWALFIYTLYHLNLSPNLGSGAGSLTAILSMITGLMVSFRNSSSSDRWHEGRRIWASLTSTIRTLQRTLAYSLPPKVGQTDAIDTAIDECMALIVAYAYALKLHLRDETDLNHPELKDLLPLPFVQRLARSSTVDSHSPIISSSPRSGGPRRTPMKRRSTPEADREYRSANTDSPRSLAQRALPGSHPRGQGFNLPLAILKQLHAYLNAFHTEPYPSSGSPKGDSPALDTPTWANALTSLKELTEQLTAAERIRDTPIPLALGIHLQQMLALYVAAIPPQLVEKLGLWCVPVTGLAAFTFFGVDRISEELSDPFGVEPNDLPLDRFCSDIRREWLELLRRSDDEESNVDWQPALPSVE